MTVESLEYFMAIAKGATFLDVAEDFNLSQSALSKIIKKLEEELGVQLFDRSGRSVKLTSIGERLYEDLLVLEPGYKKMRYHMNVSSSKRKISCMTTFPSGCLRIRNILETFTMEHPDILLAIHEERKERWKRAANALQYREMDFVIMHKPMKPFGSYKYTQLHDDYLVAILPLNHPLAQKEKIHFADIKDEKLILNFWTREVMDEVEHYTGLKATNIFISNMGREDIIWHAATERGNSLFYASDISTINVDYVTVKKIEDVPNQPILIANSPDLVMTPKHQLLQKYIINEVKKNRKKA